MARIEVSGNSRANSDQMVSYLDRMKLKGVDPDLIQTAQDYPVDVLLHPWRPVEPQETIERRFIQTINGQDMIPVHVFGHEPITRSSPRPNANETTGQEVYSETLVQEPITVFESNDAIVSNIPVMEPTGDMPSTDVVTSEQKAIPWSNTRNEKPKGTRGTRRGVGRYSNKG